MNMNFCQMSHDFQSSILFGVRERKRRNFQLPFDRSIWDVDGVTLVWCLKPPHPIILKRLYVRARSTLAPMAGQRKMQKHLILSGGYCLNDF